jgi:T5SS/PEP-CTERM-associated repeat protein
VLSTCWWDEEGDGQADRGSDGAALSNTWCHIGSLAGSNGEVIVADQGSHWDLGFLGVGDGSTGSLTIRDGATVAADRVHVAGLAGSSGVATVSNGALWSISDYIDLGRDAMGRLIVERGGRIEAQHAVVGAYAGSDGTLEVLGQDSHVTVDTSLDIGRGGTGTALLDDRADVTAGSVTAGMWPDTDGRITVANAAHLDSLESIRIGLDGTGILTVRDDGLVTTPDLVLGHMGELSGDGAVTAVVSVHGRVTPGAPVGEMTIIGDYVQLTDSTLEVELTGPDSAGGNDRMLISSWAVLDGTLKAIWHDGYVPTAGDAIQILQAAQVVGRFGNLETDDLPVGLRASIVYGDTSVSLRIDCPADFNGDGTVDSQDIVAFLSAFVTGDPSADFNRDDRVNSQDFVLFLNDFIVGC